jgi:subtilisin-like proprotein convertase family protein
MIKHTTNGGFWNEPGVFHNKWLDLPVVDNVETRDTVTVKVLQFKASGYELAGLEIMLDSIMHPRVIDLEISLTHNNVTVTFIDQVPDPGSNFLWMRLTDDATKQIADGSAPYSGNYKPQTSLNAFNGLDPDGEWILTIYDNVAGNTGMLKGWGIKPRFEKLVGVDEPRPQEIKETISWLQALPNPFPGTAQIKWTSSQAGYTTLKVFSIHGQELETITEQFMPEGQHTFMLDGSHYSPGVYYIRLQVGDAILVKKCVNL